MRVLEPYLLDKLVDGFVEFHKIVDSLFESDCLGLGVFLPQRRQVVEDDGPLAVEGGLMPDGAHIDVAEPKLPKIEHVVDLIL